MSDGGNSEGNNKTDGLIISAKGTWHWDPVNKIFVLDPATPGTDVAAPFHDINVVGSGFNDEIYLGKGNDIAHGGDGNDIIFGDRQVTALKSDGSVKTFVDYTVAQGAGNDQLFGEGGNDSLYGGAGDDLLDGGTGNDKLYGGDGADHLIGGIGNDLLDGGAGNDHLEGGANDDTLIGGKGADLLEGGDGNDTYRFGNADGNDVINDTSGTDKIVYIGDDDYAFKVLNFERLNSTNPAVAIDGIANDLRITLDGTIIDVIHQYSDPASATPAAPGTGAIESFQFDDGAKYLGFRLSEKSYVLNADSSAIVTGTNAAEIIASSNAGGTLNGNGGSDLLFGAAGIDNLNGGDGNDLLVGGAGNDFLNGGNDNDWLAGGTGDDTMDGGAGNDTATYAGAVSGTTTGVTVNLLTGKATGADQGTDTLTNIENIYGSIYNDVLTGDDTANILAGNAGNDTLNGNGGADRLDGGAGNDTLNGGAGADILIGGKGNDLLDGGAVGDTYLFGKGDGTDVINDTGNSAGDGIVFSADDSALKVLNFERLNSTNPAVASDGIANDLRIALDGTTIDVLHQYTDVPSNIGGVGAIETFTFSSGSTFLGYALSSSPYALSGDSLGPLDGADGVNDIIATSSADDILNGKSGDDLLFGNGGNDTLNGGDGNDLLVGGKGNDILTGSAGGDTLNGGNGNDRFVFTATTDSPSLTPGNFDTITDFTTLAGPNADKIDLSAIDANTTTPLDQAFAFVDNLTPGTNPGVVANSVTWYQSGGNTFVQVDVDGNTATADMVIKLTGLVTLHATDFIL